MRASRNREPLPHTPRARDTACGFGNCDRFDSHLQQIYFPPVVSKVKKKNSGRILLHGILSIPYSRAIITVVAVAHYCKTLPHRPRSACTTVIHTVPQTCDTANNSKQRLSYMGYARATDVVRVIASTPLSPPRPRLTCSVPTAPAAHLLPPLLSRRLLRVGPGSPRQHSQLHHVGSDDGVAFTSASITHCRSNDRSEKIGQGLTKGMEQECQKRD